MIGRSAGGRRISIVMRKLIFIAWLLPCLLVAGAAHSQTIRQAREQVEMSMVVRGHVDIDRGGHVTAYELEQPEKLPGYAST